MKSPRRLGAAVAALALAFSLGACGTVIKTGQNVQALWYEDGDFSAQKFKGCKPPSSRDREGLGDVAYYYPVGLRTYAFSTDQSAESGPITIRSKDSQELTITGVMQFELTSDCAKLRAFHDRIGLQYHAWFDEGASDSDGWVAFLKAYLGTPLNTAMNQAAANYNWEDLYSSTAKQAQFRADVIKLLPQQVGALIGTDTLSVEQLGTTPPQPNQALKDTLLGVQRARAQLAQQEAENEVAQKKYDSYASCRRSGATDETCRIIYLAEKGGITFYPVPTGGDINVTPPK